jgi:hypothetical protein
MSSSEDADDILLACACAVITKLLVKKNKEKNIVGRCDHCIGTENYIVVVCLLIDLKNEHAEHFKNCCRMTLETFRNLLNLIEPKIREDTICTSFMRCFLL